MTHSDKEIYEWLRDEFAAGHSPCWFGDCFRSDETCV